MSPLGRHAQGYFSIHYASQMLCMRQEQRIMMWNDDKFKLRRSMRGEDDQGTVCYRNLVHRLESFQCT
jgi:hypothetical protein